jgi:hypothetical protein
MQIAAEIWQQLASDGRSEPGWHGRRLYGTAATPIYAALKYPGVTRGLLLEVKAKSIHPSNSFPSSSSFSVSLETLAPGANGSVRICLELADMKYEGLFAVVADDVAEAVASAPSEAVGVSALVGRLNSWQKFFKRHGTNLLNEQEQVGLFAEVFVLREFLSDGLAASAALDAWRGPWGEPQDFRFGSCSVEVKATASLGSTSFEVSNLLQLDERPLAHLIVRHFTLKRVEGHGETLSDLIDEITRLIVALDPSSASRFADALLEVGYSHAHRSEYEKDGFSIHTDRQFHVRGDFPRILTDEVRAGISACSYSVQLSACLPFLIDPTSSREIIYGARDEP